LETLSHRASAAARTHRLQRQEGHGRGGYIGGDADDEDHRPVSGTVVQQRRERPAKDRPDPLRDTAEPASTQPSPDSAPPAAISARGPNRSTSQPWNGEKNGCSTISSENVACNAAGLTASAAPSGFVNSAQTYCGLEIAIMQTSPRTSCTQRADGETVVEEAWAAVVLARRSLLPVALEIPGNNRSSVAIKPPKPSSRPSPG
jgi:hypothetical protein